MTCIALCVFLQVRTRAKEMQSPLLMGQKWEPPSHSQEFGSLGVPCQHRVPKHQQAQLNGDSTRKPVTPCFRPLTVIISSSVPHLALRQSSHLLSVHLYHTRWPHSISHTLCSCPSPCPEHLIPVTGFILEGFGKLDPLPAPPPHPFSHVFFSSVFFSFSISFFICFSFYRFSSFHGYLCK